jgi:OmpA-OmpF porin, OOP family
MQHTGQCAFASLLAFSLLVLTSCASSHKEAETAVTPPSAEPAASAVHAGPSVESVSIDFRGGSATLSAEALAQLDGAARLYRDAKPEVMIVTGHTDKTGQEFPNVILSARRAAAVKQALADRGVPTDRLQIVAVGEAEPVPGVPPSRTAVVTWR